MRFIFLKIFFNLCISAKAINITHALYLVFTLKFFKVKLKSRQKCLTKFSF